MVVTKGGKAKVGTFKVVLQFWLGLFFLLQITNSNWCGLPSVSVFLDSDIIK